MSSIHRSSWLLLGFICSMALSAQRSPFNGLEVLPADSNGHYRILIGGHFHGESTNRSGYPAATLLANIDTINSLGADLFLSTGDLFMDPVNDLPRYQKAFFSKLKMPFFNAPGNHDGADEDGAPDNGTTLITIGVQPYAGVVAKLNATGSPGPSVVDSANKVVAEQVRLGMPLQAAHVLVLNTERSDGSLAVDDLESFRSLVQELFERTTSSVFIVSHRPIWAEEDPQYSPLFQGNTRSVMSTNFQKDVYPMLEQIAKHAHVYWISGSMGGTAQSSIFFQQHAPNITFIQCAIRNVPRDALLIADVWPDTVKWSALSLTGQKLLAPEAYDAAWWRKHLGRSEGFNWKLLPYLVKSTVFHRAFWWGAGLMLLLVLLVRRILRR